MSATRKLVIALAGIAVLLGIFAAATNFIEDEVGWNTTFTVLQTIITAALMVIVARDGARGADTVPVREDEVRV